MVVVLAVDHNIISPMRMASRSSSSSNVVKLWIMENKTGSKGGGDGRGSLGGWAGMRMSREVNVYLSVGGVGGAGVYLFYSICIMVWACPTRSL